VSVLPHNISNTDAAVRITKLELEIFHDNSWKLVYFGVKRSKVKVVSHNDIAGVGLWTIVSAVVY